MPDLKPTELIRAERLNNKGKVNEALQIVIKLEEKGDLNSENNLECQILKGILYTRLGLYLDAIKIGEQAFEEGKRLGKKLQSIDALFIKGLALAMLGRQHEATDNLELIKKTMDTLTSESPKELESRQALISYTEGWFFSRRGDIDETLIFMKNGINTVETIVKAERFTYFGNWAIIGYIIVCMQIGRYEEAYPYLSKFEERGNFTPLELSFLSSHKAEILLYRGEYQEALKLIERSLISAQDLILKNNFLMLKARSLIGLTKWSEAEEIFVQFEESIKSQKDIIKKISTTPLQRWRAQLYFNRSQIFVGKGELDQALKHAMRSLLIYEKIIVEEVWRGISLFQIAHIYKYKGDLDHALEYSNRCMTIKQTPAYFKTLNFAYILGIIYEIKGELDLALDYFERALVLSKKIYLKGVTSSILNLIGEVYWRKGDIQKALEYIESSLAHSEESDKIQDKAFAIFWLININIDTGSLEKAQQYLYTLQQISNSYEIKIIEQLYKIAKALILKTSTRARNRVEAEELLREVTEEEIVVHKYTVIALVNLAILLLEELEKSNDPEILDDINPIIQQLVKIAEDQHSYSLLAETKLLQGRLALLNLNLNFSRELLTQAQEIATEHGLQLLAKKISNEHDNLLEELETWQSFKNTRMSLSKRLKRSDLGIVLDRLLGKRAIESPELNPEEPILLLIIAEGGIPAFSKIFTEEWGYENGFMSNFLTAFNTFSEEVFAKGLDRAKFGDYVLVMDSVGSFSVGYLFKGQSYLAKQKLIQFAHRMQNTASIWQVFEDFHKTHHPIILSENDPLHSLITEIFLKNNLEISTPL
ncbi:MAG: tetratricopeptide repeat protein [Promethearchaeota archaeon]|jgi:tetratricopeptide (TPR) repeat protein